MTREEALRRVGEMLGSRIYLPNGTGSYRANELLSVGDCVSLGEGLFAERCPPNIIPNGVVIGLEQGLDVEVCKLRRNPEFDPMAMPAPSADPLVARFVAMDYIPNGSFVAMDHSGRARRYVNGDVSAGRMLGVAIDFDNARSEVTVNGARYPASFSNFAVGAVDLAAPGLGLFTSGAMPMVGVVDSGFRAPEYEFAPKPGMRRFA